MTQDTPHPSPQPPLHSSIAILTGGRGQRMGGCDKSQLTIHGKTLLHRVLDVVRPLSDDILLVGGGSEKGTTSVPDAEDMRDISGPLRGIYTALRHARHPHVLVVPCDAPFLHPDALTMLLTEAGQLCRNTTCIASDSRHDTEPETTAEPPCYDAIVPRQEDGFWFPLLAIYARSCLPAIETMREEGIPHVFRLFSRIATREISMEMLRRADPELRSLINVNTPEDLTALHNGTLHQRIRLATRPKRWQIKDTP